MERAMLLRRLLTLSVVAVSVLASSSTETRADAVTDWNAIALGTMPATLQGPPQARILGYVHAAVYDAVNAVERKYAHYALDVAAPPGASAEAAAVGAAHDMLVRFYPAQQPALDKSLDTSLQAITDVQARSDGLAVGRSVAAHIHALSVQDGADATAPAYVPRDDPAAWQFTAPGMVPRGPTWGAIRPFLLTSPRQFPYDGPLSVRSEAYAKDIEEVRRLGAVDSAQRTSDQTAAAIFWTVSMPSLFNDVVRTEAKRKGLGLAENARLFALFNMATSDSQTATWAEKFNSAFLRPVTAIQLASKLGNPGIEQDPGWTPLLVTPAHPDYPSGHCAYAGAAVRMLQLVFGTDAAEASYTYPTNGVTRHYTSYSRMANEVVDARVWGGIHTRTADERADRIGRRISEYAFREFLRPL
jgi:hypothetical protein